MFTMLTAVAQAGADDGLLIALAVASAATALAAIGMTVAAKLRHARVNRTMVGIGAGFTLALVVGGLIVGGALTRPPAAAADGESVGKVPGHGPVEIKIDGFQLPTL